MEIMEINCARKCNGCQLGKHVCGGRECDGQGCCACQGETSLAIHKDADEGGCRDPRMESWSGSARLDWIAGGRQVGQESLTFTVHCMEQPQEPGLKPIDMRRLVTLQLVCAEARKRYGVPPRSVRVDVEMGLDDSTTEPVLSRARWRLGQGFCHGMGILGVASPPPGARLADIHEQQHPSPATTEESST
jgi:hypothetical protein